ncbi:uncharacterized protein CELE_Y81G3A.6 [Caenorhabditis elegans]|uniref:Secreted protein n=1 Tax=Caenorhabditis elegans TaxID=6239 RepID=D6VPB0_CAEEL|nr:Secreted protein [Caenorhabditis elegans]CBM41249.1 Secreted protein [Caenorhabditis elegans]|eukprot:NP_001254369.1 Uncharacterized protein CELE_Y81G3A.6 [Caenorhabditis elegans]
MDFKSIYLLTIFVVKAISATRNISIFEAYPFIAYFNAIQCSLFLFFTVIVLITTAINFYQTTPPKLILSRPSLFEYYIVVGEEGSSHTRSVYTNPETGARTETTGAMESTACTGTESGTATGTGTETFSYYNS